MYSYLLSWVLHKCQSMCMYILYSQSPCSVQSLWKIHKYSFFLSFYREIVLQWKTLITCNTKYVYLSSALHKTAVDKAILNCIRPGRDNQLLNISPYAQSPRKCSNIKIPAKSKEKNQKILKIDQEHVKFRFIKWFQASVPLNNTGWQANCGFSR